MFVTLKKFLGSTHCMWWLYIRVCVCVCVCEEEVRVWSHSQFELTGLVSRTTHDFRISCGFLHAFLMCSMMHLNADIILLTLSSSWSVLITIVWISLSCALLRTSAWLFCIFVLFLAKVQPLVDHYGGGNLWHERVPGGVFNLICLLACFFLMPVAIIPYIAGVSSVTWLL